MRDLLIYQPINLPVEQFSIIDYIKTQHGLLSSSDVVAVDDQDWTIWKVTPESQSERDMIIDIMEDAKRVGYKVLDPEAFLIEVMALSKVTPEGNGVVEYGLAALDIPHRIESYSRHGATGHRIYAENEEDLQDIVELVRSLVQLVAVNPYTFVPI